METTFDSDKRKLFSIASHGSIFVSQLVLSAGIPAILMFISDDPVVKDNAKEALNFPLQYVALQRSADYSCLVDYRSAVRRIAWHCADSFACFCYLEQRYRSGPALSLSLYFSSALGLCFSRINFFSRYHLKFVQQFGYLSVGAVSPFRGLAASDWVSPLA